MIDGLGGKWWQNKYSKNRENDEERRRATEQDNEKCDKYRVGCFVWNEQNEQIQIQYEQHRCESIINHIIIRDVVFANLCVIY